MTLAHPPVGMVTRRHLHNVQELKPCQFRQVDNGGRILCGLIKGGDREVSVQLCSACPVAQINCQNLRAGLEKQVSTPITVRFATGRVEVWDDAPPTIDFKQAACAAKTMPIRSPRDCAGCPIRLPNIIPQNAIQVAHRAKQNAPASAQHVVAATPGPASRPARSGARVSQPVTAAMAVSPANSIGQAQFIAAPHAPALAQAASIDLGAANDLIARAKATSARKAEEKRARELERTVRQEQESYDAPHQAKPKIIQLQEWLAGQLNKKQNGDTRANSSYKPQAVRADADGVSDIVYAPLGAPSAAYQETVDYERCVGWTD